MTKVPITTSIHIEKKELFEATKLIHGYNLTDYLDECLDALFSRIVPDKAIQIEIQNKEAELREMKDNQVKLSVLMEQAQKVQKKAKKEEEKVVNNKWLERFEIYKVSSLYLINKKDKDFFKLAVSECGFKSVQEAEEKICQKLKDEGLYGCTICKKWLPKKQVCSTGNKLADENFTCRSWEKR